MQQKIIEWIKRYLPAGILSTTATLTVSFVTYKLTKNNLTTALVATWTGNIVYFAYILLIDIIKTKDVLTAKNKKYTLTTFWLNVRALFAEFGISNFFDTLLIRPALMYYFPIWLDDIVVGIIIAKVLADIIFYILTILAYEFFKKKLKRFD